VITLVIQEEYRDTMAYSRRLLRYLTNKAILMKTAIYTTKGIGYHLACVVVNNNGENVRKTVREVDSVPLDRISRIFERQKREIS
jgi:ribosomal protein S13